LRTQIFYQTVTIAVHIDQHPIINFRGQKKDNMNTKNITVPECSNWAFTPNLMFLY